MPCVVTTFLEQLDGPTRHDLLTRGRRRHFPARSVLFFDGDVGTDVLVIVAGEVKVSLTVDGREVVLDVLGPGELLGELAAIDPGRRSATATAITDVDARAIAGPAFAEFLEAHPAVAVELLRLVSARLRGASRRQVEYGALDAVGRVCARLVELMERFGQTTDAGVVIGGPLTQSDIAAWAGLSREAVVKALHSLRAVGWVETTGRSITVVDAGAVRARAAVTLDGG